MFYCTPFLATSNIGTAESQNMSLQDISHQQRRRAYLFVVCQAVLVLPFAVLAWLLWDLKSGGSLLTGGLVCALPNLYFARQFFSTTGAMAAKQILRGMYRAEMIKLLLTAVLFMVVFTYLPVKAGFLFVGFVLAQLTVWFAPLLI